ncbi:hypothetical protein XENOCAPTIV_019084, partial [Xenoophorus captivus]
DGRVSLASWQRERSEGKRRRDEQRCVSAWMSRVWCAVPPPVRLDCRDVACQPGNLCHEALYGYRLGFQTEPPLELMLSERSLNLSPEVNTDPTHRLPCT